MQNIQSKTKQGSRGKSPNRWDWFVGAAILGALTCWIYLTFHHHSLAAVLTEAETHHWARLILRPSIIWTSSGLVLLVFRTVLWFCYRPFTPAKLEDAPSMTVIIPAYNEGSMVLKSIESVAAAYYPRGRLEILVVDDGSTDDTWRYIRQGAARHPDLVKPMRFPENRGKRAALAMGFASAAGTVLVTLDSDSIVERNALLALAGPFRNPRIGAVAGKVVVYNRRQGLIPRMLNVQFILSFDLQRAVESCYGNVFCCPGALTAYRASLVREVVDRWMGQTFLGSRCTFGEDRAMTNLILESGYDTVYQRSAVVHTIVPLTYSKLCKMLIRWNRSYVREEVRFLKVVWKRPVAARLIALYDRIITNLRYPVQYANLFLLVLLAIHHPWMLARLALAIGLMSALNTIYYLRSARSTSAMVSSIPISRLLPYSEFFRIPHLQCGRVPG